VLRSPILHPPLLAALGAAGHGARVLIADANYSHSTNIGPRAALIHLNLRPGLVTVDQVLEPVRPDDGSTPAVYARYRELLGEGLPLRPVERLSFYAECRQPDLAVCVATGDDRLYANMLLTIGYIEPGRSFIAR